MAETANTKYSLFGIAGGQDIIIMLLWCVNLIRNHYLRWILLSYHAIIKVVRQTS